MPASKTAFIVVPDPELIRFADVNRVEAECIELALFKAVALVVQRDVVCLALVTIKDDVDIGICAGAFDVAGQHPALPADLCQGAREDKKIIINANIMILFIICLATGVIE